MVVMCGRFSLYEPVRELADRFSVDEVITGDLPPRWNLAPTQQIVAIASSLDGDKRLLGTMRWGLVPIWAKDLSFGNRAINARSETVATNRMFSPAFERRRCLIPASGFYEWKKDAATSGKATSKQAFHIHSADGTPLALGGLWEVWHDAQGQPVRSCAIITMASNSLMSQVHERMPLVLGEQDWNDWLAPQPLSSERQAELFEPSVGPQLVIDRVSNKVNSARNEGCELIEPELIEPEPVESGPVALIEPEPVELIEPKSG